MTNENISKSKPLESHESLFVNPADYYFANRKKEEILDSLVDNLDDQTDEQIWEKLAEAKFYSRYEDVIFQDWWLSRSHDFTLNKWEDLEEHQKDKWRKILDDNATRLTRLIAEVKSK